VCTTWLGGLKVLRYKSKIEQEQLGKHLEALKQTTLIKDYAIERNTKGDGFNLVVTPGEGFFEDYERFYLKHIEIDQQYIKAEERKRQEQPFELVKKFYQNLYHREDLSGMMIQDTEIQLAKQLLETHTPEEITDLILYTIDAARRENKEIRAFGSVKMYFNAWHNEKATKAKRAALEKKQAAKQREQKLRDEHLDWWRDEVKRLRDAASPDEIAALEEQATAELGENNQNSFGFDFMVQRGVDTLLADRYHVPEFEEWLDGRKTKVS
jgi:Glu-tRNA(Gln) amidotransferase subunit E-like FAD-binding protein